MSDWVKWVMGGLATPAIIGIWIGIRKMYKRHKERSEKIEKYNPSMCIKHGKKIDELSKEVKEMRVESNLVTRGMFELITKEKFGQTNGGLDDLYEAMVDHLTNKN